MNFKQALIMAILISASFSSFAENTGKLSEKDEAEVLNKAVSYINSISCSELDNVDTEALPLNLHINDKATDNKRYAVLWNGNTDCSAGSGSGAVNIVVVNKGETGYYVDSIKSSPSISFNVPTREFKFAKSLHSQAIIVVGNTYGPNDSNCCPSITKMFTVTLQADNNWKTTFEDTVDSKQDEAIIKLMK